MSGQIESLTRLKTNIEKVIVGKSQTIDFAMIALLCKGHLLIEDMPGLGKTMLARALSASIALSFKRVQFTPDLLPSDITGVSIFNQKRNEFEFKRGPVFTNILLADEINRATPRTQSSLLECMEEKQVTVDGTTNPLPAIFMVLATQNPIELHGTYPLPEAQLDRFFMKLKMGYPSVQEEVKLVEMQTKEHPIQSITPVISEEEILNVQNAVTDVYVSQTVLKYIVDVVDRTRHVEDLVVGASPRGSLALRRACQAIALMHGMDFVDPVLIKTAALPVLSHRLIVKPQSRLRGITADKIITTILAQVPVPVK